MLFGDLGIVEVQSRWAIVGGQNGDFKIFDELVPTGVGDLDTDITNGFILKIQVRLGLKLVASNNKVPVVLTSRS